MSHGCHFVQPRTLWPFTFGLQDSGASSYASISIFHWHSSLRFRSLFPQ
jgi:hypothetical protein